MPSVIYEVARLLEQYDHKVSNAVKLSHELEIPWNKVRHIALRYDLGQTSPYLLFDAILTQWSYRHGKSATIGKLCEALEFTELLQTSENLKSKFPTYVIVSKSRVPLPPAFGLKPVIANFTGRSEQLDILNEFFCKEERVVVISGQGGIGKTELTKKFIIDIGSKDENMQIVKSWFCGETAALLGHFVVKFCQDLEISEVDSKGKVLKVKELFEKIFTKLCSLGDFKWVVVIDNVDELYPDFEYTLQYLLQLQNVFVIVTSRFGDIFPQGFKHIPLIQLNLEEGMQLAKANLKWDGRECENVVKKFCEMLGNFPLAINQACGYIRQMRLSSLKGEAYGVRDYLDYLGRQKALDLDILNLPEYPHTMLTIWNCSFDRLQNNFGEMGKIALNILNILAFINADDIKLEFIGKLNRKFYSCEISKIMLENSLTVLHRYSFITRCNKVTSINRIVQTAIRERMSQSKKDVEILSQFWVDFDANEWEKAEMTSVIKLWVHTSQIPELHEYSKSNVSGLLDHLEKMGLYNAIRDNDSAKIIPTILMNVDEHFENFLEGALPSPITISPGSDTPATLARLLDSWTVHDLATVLDQTETVNEWRRITDALGLDWNDLKAISNQWESGAIPPYALLKNSLELWDSKRGKEASIDKLCEALESAGLEKVSGDVKARWSANARMYTTHLPGEAEDTAIESLANLRLVRSTSFPGDDNAYPCPKHGPRGFALILNIFNKEHAHRRLSSMQDISNLLHLFEELAYPVVVAHDSIQGTGDLREHIEHFKEMLHTAKEQIGSVIVICCSHSTSGVFFNRSHRKHFEESLVDHFQSTNFPSLQGVPKIFLFQSFCEDPEGHLHMPTDPTTATWKDTILCFPRSHSFESYRANNIGSLFMHCFIKTVKQHAHEQELPIILDKVRLELTALEKKIMNDNGVMSSAPLGVPMEYVCYGYNKRFYFNTVPPFDEKECFS